MHIIAVVIISALVFVRFVVVFVILQHGNCSIMRVFVVALVTVEACLFYL